MDQMTYAKETIDDYFDNLGDNFSIFTLTTEVILFRETEISR